MKNQFGKVSKLDITAAKKDGKTILSDVSFTAPFKIMRPYYEKGQMCVMLLTASAGVMAGDRQEFYIHAGENTDMKFLSQAYEKIHRMEEGFAQREASLTVGKNARLFYSPLPTIPFHDSDFRSSLCVNLEDETSRFLMTEVISCGRVAHGEEFLYKNFQNHIKIYQGGKLVYLDNTRYRPGEMDMRGFGLYEGFTHLGNLVICNEPKSEEWIRSVRELLDGQEDVEGGVTRTAFGHVVVRILGKSGQRLTELQENIIKL